MLCVHCLAVHSYGHIKHCFALHTTLFVEWILNIAMEMLDLFILMRLRTDTALPKPNASCWAKPYARAAREVQNGLNHYVNL
jgi:hypothetical protein